MPSHSCQMKLSFFLNIKFSSNPTLDNKGYPYPTSHLSRGKKLFDISIAVRETYRLIKNLDSIKITDSDKIKVVSKNLRPELPPIVVKPLPKGEDFATSIEDTTRMPCLQERGCLFISVSISSYQHR